MADINWGDAEFVYLRKQFELGRVVLFTGAGFSVDSLNQIGTAPPLGGKLAELLALQAGFPYNGELLPSVYEAVRKQIGEAALWDLLESNYRIVEYNDWYNTVKSITWYRIYTANIDNLFQRIYAIGATQSLRTIVHPSPHQDHDDLFRTLQCVHLHGHVEHRPNGLLFTLPEFGGATATQHSWYQALIDDIYNRPVIFIGSQLQEPMFYHYIELRTAKDRGIQEVRPKSYLVSPHVGPIVSAALKERNIVPIESSAKEFFESLSKQIDIADLSMQKVRQRAIPYATFLGDSANVDERINRHFDFIVPGALPYLNKNRAEDFFMGAEADWYDIHEERDAIREITLELIDRLIEPRKEFECFVLHGPAGSGKTTTLLRAAQILASKGHEVFYAKGLERLDLSGLLSLAATPANKDKRFIIVIDVLSRHQNALQVVSERLKEASNVTLLVAERSNKYVSIRFPILDHDPIEIRMPDLCETDVKAIIAKLSQFGFLGELRGKTEADRIKAFMERADKQLLVALREATSGEGFDFILRTEYNELIPAAKLAYTICSIAVAHGAPGVYMRHLLPCLGRTDFKKAVVIRDLLRGILLPANPSETMVKPRHRLIAYWVATEIASQGEKVEAITTFLRQVASDINPNEIRRRSPAYLAYRGMINSEQLKETLSGDYELILGIYDELKPFYDSDFLFWLQYGMACIGAGKLDIAENYLNQSLAMYPNSHQTLHQMGCLYLIKATRAPNQAPSVEKAKEGIGLLKEQILTKGDENSYPYHAYLTHVGRWYSACGTTISQKEWEALRAVGTEAKKKYPRDDLIQSAVMEVERSYLTRAVVEKPEEESTDP